MYRSRRERKAKKLRLEKLTTIALKSKILRKTGPMTKRTPMIPNYYKRLFLSLSVDHRNKLHQPVKKETKVIGDQQEVLDPGVILDPKDLADQLDQKEIKEIEDQREILGQEVPPELLAQQELLEQRDLMEQEVLKVKYFSIFVN
jgi:hypothetical protein